MSEVIPLPKLQTYNNNFTSRTSEFTESEVNPNNIVSLPFINEEEEDKNLYKDRIFRYVDPEKEATNPLVEEETTIVLPELEKYNENSTNIYDTVTPLPNIEFSSTNEIVSSVPLGKDNTDLVDIYKYFESLGSHPNPDKKKLHELYKDNKLTKADIVGDKVLMEILRGSIESRYSPTVVSKLYGGVSAVLGADSGGVSVFSPIKLFDRDYREMSDNEVFDRWQNWMRAFNVGNSVTVVNEILAGMNAPDAERAKIGAGYILFSKMGNIFTTGTWADLGDGLIDYGRGGIYDPVNLLSLGIGRLIAQPIIKGKAQATKTLMVGAYKSMLANGVSKEVARKKVMSSLATRRLLTNTAAFAVPDFIFNVSLDLLQQTQLINTDVQEELDLNRTSIVAFASMLFPALFAGSSIGIRKLRESDLFKDTFIAYDEINNLVQTSRRSVEEVLNNKVKNKLPEIIDIMDEHFGNIKGDPSKLKAWTDAKLQAKKVLDEELANNNDPRNQDLSHTLGFFEDLFLDTVEKVEKKKLIEGTTIGAKISKEEKTYIESKIITKGYLSVLRDAGFVFHPDMIEKYKVSGILGQAIKYLPDDVLKKLVKSYEERTGKSLHLGDNFNVNPGEVLSARFIDTVSVTGKFLNLPSKAVREIMMDIDDDVGNALKIAMETMPKTKDPAAILFLMSNYKRILTSHPATTGANLKGFAALSFMDSVSELMSGLIHLTQVPYQKFLNKDDEKLQRAINGAASNFFSSVNRFQGILAPDLPMEYAMKVIDMNPTVAAKLFRDIAGDGGIRSGVKSYDLDPQGLLFPLAKTLDGVTKGTQTVALVRLQDEYTKLISFGINLDKFIIDSYGVSPAQFWRRPDIATEMFTPKFKLILEKATYQTLRQTASVNWTKLNKMHGQNFFRELARVQSNISNKTIGGFALPFGDFNNTVIANFGDFSGINFLRFMFLRHGLKKELDPATQDTTTALAKASAAYTLIFLRTFYGENSGISKVDEGRAFNQNYSVDGNLQDSLYDWPQMQFDLVAQILAHGLSGGGRDFKKDIEAFDGNPLEIKEYMMKNFRRENIPSELVEKLSAAVLTGAYKDLDKIYNFVTRDFLGMINGTNPKDVDEFLFESLGTVVGRISSGFMRPVEPVNMVFNLLRFDGKVPDLKQGNKTYNEAFKYINSLLPEDNEYSVSQMKDKYTLLQSDDLRFDLTKNLFGARGSQKLSQLTTMLNMAGYNAWNLTQEAWGKDPRVRNALNRMAAPIAESLAIKYLNKYPNYKTSSLEYKRQVIKELRKELIEKSLEQLEMSAPKNLSIIRDLLKKGNTVKRNKAINFMIKGGMLKEGTTLDDIIEMEDEEESIKNLEHLRYLIKNYDSIFIFGEGPN